MMNKKKDFHFRCRLLISIAFIFLKTTLSAQTDLGIGLVSITFDEKTTLHFYSAPNDEQPTATLQFFDDHKINSISIRDLEKHEVWLKPEVLGLDYLSFIFRCSTIENNWMEVIVNNETGKTLWLKQSNIITFDTWESYIINMFLISRLPYQNLPEEKQKIRSFPHEDSVEIIYDDEDCFQVKSMKGDWIEIYTTDICDDYPAKSKFMTVQCIDPENR
jgi:hypothetical protein